MAELVREIMIDATPETIWPFLVEPGKHIEWDGTVAELDPRPGGIYRVLVAGQHQSAGEYVEVVPMEKVVYTFGWEQEGDPSPPGSPTVDTDAAAAFDPSAAAVIDAWHDPAVQERTAHMPFGDVPGDVALGIHLTESVVHGWDLAKSTGQPTERDPELVAFAWRHVKELP